MKVIEFKIEGLKAQHKQAIRNLDMLTLTSPIDGIIQLHTDEPLVKLDGRYMPLQTNLFVVYERGQFEAVAAINHRDYGLIEPNLPTQIKLWSFDGEVFESRVVEKSPSPVARLYSPALSAAFGGQVPTMPAATPIEALEPAENTYQLELPIQQKELLFREGMVGKAKIQIGKKSLASLFYRWLLQTLRQDIRL